MDKWKIWLETFNNKGERVGAGVYVKEYEHKSSAIRRAKQLFDDNPNIKWTVSQTNPFV